MGVVSIRTVRDSKQPPSKLSGLFALNWTKNMTDFFIMTKTVILI